jgi:hypothetical protein
MSKDLSRDRDLGISLEIDISAEIQGDGYDRNRETLISDSRSTYHEESPRSSRRESSLVRPDAVFDAGYQRLSSDIQGSPKHFPFLQNVEESSRSTSPRSSPVVIAVIKDFHPSIPRSPFYGRRTPSIESYPEYVRSVRKGSA